MAKRFGRVTPKGTRPANYRPNMHTLADQAKALKAEVEETKARIAKEHFDGASSDETVKCTLTGEGQPVSVTIDPVALTDSKELEAKLLEALGNAWTTGALARKEAVDAVIAQSKVDLGLIGLDGIIN